MKKIGITTFFQAENYGAVLQAYALSKYIETLDKDNDVKIINFKTKEQEKVYAIFKLHKMSLFRRVCITILILLHYIKFHRRKKRFHQFVLDKLKLTQHYSTQTDILSSPPIMDIYISGSDQVFNPFRPNHEVYYLDFDKKKSLKVAYAPSFGIRDFNEEVENLVAPLIKDFDYLSCREDDGSKFIGKIVAREIPTVVDPVFLLNKNQWLEIAKKPDIKEKYICIYDLNGGLKLVEIAQKISKETGLPIYCITKNVTKRYNVKQKIYDAGPLEFLGLIAYSEYLVTDSFHGTSFATLFGKKFVSYNAFPKASSRITSILERFDLMDNYVDNKNDFNARAIDLKSVDMNIVIEFADLSKKYLTDIITC